MEQSKWFRWLSATTGETSERMIAKRVGVTHTTVHRWVHAGVPAARVWQLTLRFRGDPIAALVLLGRIEEHQVDQLNWETIVKYAPIEVLSAELDGRIAQGARLYPDEAASLQKRSTGL